MGRCVDRQIAVEPEAQAGTGAVELDAQMRAVAQQSQIVWKAAEGFFQGRLGRQYVFGDANMLARGLLGGEELDVPCAEALDQLVEQLAGNARIGILELRLAEPEPSLAVGPQCIAPICGDELEERPNESDRQGADRCSSHSRTMSCRPLAL